MDRIFQTVMLYLVFSDNMPKYFVRNLDITVFENEGYGEAYDVMFAVWQYWEEYGIAPKKNLKNFEEYKYERYRTIIDSVLSFEDFNEKYSYDIIEKYLTEHNAKKILQNTLYKLEKGDGISEVKESLKELNKHSGLLFKKGFNITTDYNQIYREDGSDEFFYVETGMVPVDRLEAYPRSGKLFTCLAPSSRGKSFFLVEMGARSALKGLRTLHISLELSDKDVAKRYISRFLGVPLASNFLSYYDIKIDGDNKFASFGKDDLTNRHEMTPNYITINRKMGVFVELFPNIENNLLISHFPSGSMTFDEIKSYIEWLGYEHKFYPDVLILDYPDILWHPDNFRTESIIRAFTDYRGFCQEKNVIGITVSQSNREGEKNKWLSMENNAEAYGKARVSDSMIAISKTDYERSQDNLKNISRISLLKSNGTEAGVRFIIGQDLNKSRFVRTDVQTNWAYYSPKYFKEISKNE